MKALDFRLLKGSVEKLLDKENGDLTRHMPLCYNMYRLNQQKETKKNMPISELIEFLTGYMRDWGNIPVVMQSGDGKSHLAVNRVSYFPKSFITYPGRQDLVEAPVVELAHSGFDISETTDSKETENTDELLPLLGSDNNGTNTNTDIDAKMR